MKYEERLEVHQQSSELMDQIKHIPDEIISDNALAVYLAAMPEYLASIDGSPNTDPYEIAEIMLNNKDIMIGIIQTGIMIGYVKAIADLKKERIVV